jgi:hypothetical protein
MILIKSRGIKIIIINFKSGKRIERMIFINDNKKTMLIKCTYYQNGKTIKTIKRR